ncbi:zinc finger protein 558-like [Penaeus chinensis]|uniref:zinc finger protein 558-like n=1 Tax=Penaeus chinensis TaxID=139456 RepID=UPI001FB68F12|nr:zinc finger protein 558-like [Penaeus chinensis]XP_047473758.1 zinc finger protein 558-like [Penaeus chinensis]
MSSRKKRVDLNIAQKLDVIKKLESDISVDSLSEEYGVTKETVLDIYKAKAKIMDFYHKYSVREDSQENVQYCGGVEARKRIKTSEHIISGKRNCSYCNKTVSSQRALKIHERLHIGKGILQCSVCGKTYLNKEKFIIHFRIHTGERPFECSLCNKKFSDNSILRRHEKTHKPYIPYECTVCQKKFDLETAFREHLKCHADLKKFSCADCDMKFNSKANLSRHIKIHTGEKPFKCSFCDKSFTSKSDLKRHLKIHNGEKVSCSQCNKTFNDLSNLRIHERIHTGEKPYECSYCGKAFVSSSNCKVHEKIHKNERPFQCELCNKSFREKCKLERHKKTHRDTAFHSKVPCVSLGNSTCEETFVSPAPKRKYYKPEQSEEAAKFSTLGQEVQVSFTKSSNYMLDSAKRYNLSVHDSSKEDSHHIRKSPIKYSHSMHKMHNYLTHEPTSESKMIQSVCESPIENSHSMHESQPKNSPSKFRTGENRPKKLIQNKISSFFPTKEIVRPAKELHAKKSLPDATKPKDDWRVFVSILIVNMEACLKRQYSEKERVISE